MSGLNWEKAARRDASRGLAREVREAEVGGQRVPWGSAPATRTQVAEIELLAAELEIPGPTGLVTRNVARRWLAKARVRRALESRRRDGDG